MTIHRYRPDTGQQHPDLQETFSVLNPRQLLDAGETPTRIRGVVDQAGHRVTALGTKLVTNGILGVDMLDVPPNARFPLHTHPGHHCLLCIRGVGTFTLAGTVHEVQPGDLLMVEGAVPHAVGAGPEGHTLLAFGSPHMPLDSPARMVATLESDDETADAIRASMYADEINVRELSA